MKQDDYLLQYVLPLLLAFQLKHFLCDYPLQGRYMLGKFKPGWGWVLPLSAHALVHGLFTTLISFLFIYIVHPEYREYWWPVHVKIALTFGLLDFWVHFIVDRIKASPHLLGRWKPDQKPFWMALGLDQMLHHLTHYFIIYRILLA